MFQGPLTWVTGGVSSERLPIVVSSATDSSVAAAAETKILDLWDVLLERYRFDEKGFGFIKTEGFDGENEGFGDENARGLRETWGLDWTAKDNILEDVCEKERK